MKATLVDNGSLEPAAHEGLREAAAAIGARAEFPVDAVSWKHSDRIPGGSLRGGAAQTLAPWIRAQVLAGEREFLFVPFFISPQGAVGSLLYSDIVRLQRETGGFAFSFTAGLADGQALSSIIAGRVRETASARGLRRPEVVVVDHGGPSRESAAIRDRVADGVRAELGQSIGTLSAASMESPDGPGFEFNRPLLADALGAQRHGPGDVVIAPLFLLPGRHAGPGGDLARIARASQARCHFTGLVGSHPVATETLADALARALGAAALS